MNPARPTSGDNFDDSDNLSCNFKPDTKKSKS